VNFLFKVENMTSKDWYQFPLNEKVLEEEYTWQMRKKKIK